MHKGAVPETRYLGSIRVIVRRGEPHLPAWKIESKTILVNESKYVVFHLLQMRPYGLLTMDGGLRSYLIGEAKDESPFVLPLRCNALDILRRGGEWLLIRYLECGPLMTHFMVEKKQEPVRIGAWRLMFMASDFASLQELAKKPPRKYDLPLMKNVRKYRNEAIYSESQPRLTGELSELYYAPDRKLSEVFVSGDLEFPETKIHLPGVFLLAESLLPSYVPIF